MADKYVNTNCLDCGKPKAKAPSTRVFRSPYCRSCAIKRRWARDGNAPLICQKCGRRFPFDQSGGKPRKFCSKECRKRTVEKTCPKCCKVFAVARSNANRYNFCSVACAHEPSVTRNCEVCNAPFTLNASEAKVRGRYCSFRCYRRSTKETSIERKVREVLTAEGISLVSEFKIEGSCKRDVFDFYAPRFNLLIECDGNYWHSRAGVKKRDAAKTKRATRLGYRVERLPEALIKSDRIRSHLLSLLSQQSLL